MASLGQTVQDFGKGILNPGNPYTALGKGEFGNAAQYLVQAAIQDALKRGLGPAAGPAFDYANQHYGR